MWHDARVCEVQGVMGLDRVRNGLGLGHLWVSRTSGSDRRDE